MEVEQTTKNITTRKKVHVEIDRKKNQNSAFRKKNWLHDWRHKNHSMFSTQCNYLIWMKTRLSSQSFIRVSLHFMWKASIGCFLFGGAYYFFWQVSMNTQKQSDRQDEEKTAERERGTHTHQQELEIIKRKYSVITMKRTFWRGNT